MAAIAIVGGNIYGYDQTLASATSLVGRQAPRYAEAVAIAIVLLGLILVLMADWPAPAVRAAASACAPVAS